MPTNTADVNEVFRALADPTRRQVIERLTRGPASVSELSKPFDMAMPSLLQHLTTLEKGGLVTSSKKGRVRTFRLVPQTIRLAEDWLSAQRALWEKRLDQHDAYLLELYRKEQQ